MCKTHRDHTIELYRHKNNNNKKKGHRNWIPSTKTKSSEPSWKQRVTQIREVFGLEALLKSDEAIEFYRGQMPRRKTTSSPSESLPGFYLHSKIAKSSKSKFDALQISACANTKYEGFVILHTGFTRGIIRDPHIMEVKV